MSKADDAWKKAWDECLKKAAEGDYQVDHGSFMDGYEAGRADALVLPEVRAEELERGRVYQAFRNGKWILVEMGVSDLFDFECHEWLSICEYSSFRGPLPLGGGKDV